MLASTPPANENQPPASYSRARATGGDVVARIEISLRSRGRSERYDVRDLDTGEALLRSCRDPVYDTCRVLAAAGRSGILEVWRVSSAYPSMRVDIALGSKVTVRETATEGPRLVRWRPFDAALPPRRLANGSDFEPGAGVGP